MKACPRCGSVAVSRIAGGYVCNVASCGFRRRTFPDLHNMIDKTHDRAPADYVGSGAYKKRPVRYDE